MSSFAIKSSVKLSPNEQVKYYKMPITLYTPHIGSFTSKENSRKKKNPSTTGEQSLNTNYSISPNTKEHHIVCHYIYRLENKRKSLPKRLETMYIARKRKKDSY